MTHFLSAADLFAAVGKSLGATGWREVTRAEVEAHAAVTGTPAWVAAGTGPLPDPAVHGAFTLALASPWLAELLAVDGYALVDYGLDRVRFPAPVALGSRLRAHGLLLDMRLEDDAVRTVVELRYESSSGGQPPCVAQVVSLLLPQP